MFDVKLVSVRCGKCHERVTISEEEVICSTPIKHFDPEFDPEVEVEYICPECGEETTSIECFEKQEEDGKRAIEIPGIYINGEFYKQTQIQ